MLNRLQSQNMVYFQPLNGLIMTKLFIAVISLFFSSCLFAQPAKNTRVVNQAWTGYFNQTRFSRNLGTWTDLQLRTREDFFSNLSVSILRVGLTYYLNDNTKLTAGYAYVNQFPGDNPKNISRPEHRPWQQLQWHTRYSKVRTMQWLRLEERYRRKILNDDNLAAGYNFNYRLRYNFLLNIPVGKKGISPGGWSFVINDEVHVNFGKEIVYNYFDQNRFFTGFSYHTNASDNLQIGYLYVFQQLAAGNSYRNIQGMRILYFHNLDLRKK